MYFFFFSSSSSFSGWFVKNEESKGIHIWLEPKAGKIWRRWQHFWIAQTFRKKVEWAQRKLFLAWYLNLITFRGTGKKSTENIKYDLNDVKSYQIIFWFTSGIPMHIKCFKTARSINSTYQTLIENMSLLYFLFLFVCFFFFFFFFLFCHSEVPQPFLIRGNMLAQRKKGIKVPIAGGLHSPGQFLVGVKFFTRTN